MDLIRIKAAGNPPPSGTARHVHCPSLPPAWRTRQGCAEDYHSKNASSGFSVLTSLVSSHIGPTDPQEGLAQLPSPHQDGPGHKRGRDTGCGVVGKGVRALLERRLSPSSASPPTSAQTLLLPSPPGQREPTHLVTTGIVPLLHLPPPGSDPETCAKMLPAN